jgi:hypothetical protein
MKLKKHKSRKFKKLLRKYKGKNIKRLLGRSKIDAKDNLDKSHKPLRFTERDLRGSDFSGMHLESIDFSGADLRGASFRFSILKGAKFENTIIGISNKARICSELASGALAVLAGLTLTYSLDYFFFLIDKNLIQDFIPPEISVVLVFFGMFIALVLWAILIGVGTFFSGFFVLVVSISFLIQAISGDDIAATSVHSLSCFVGSLSGIFIHSQAIYLSKELNGELKFLPDSLRACLLDILAVLGSVIGAYIGGHSSQDNVASTVLISCTVIALLCGHNLGSAAELEKIDYVQVKEDFFELSGNKENFTFGEFKKKRKEKLTAKKYAVIRVFFDACLNRLRTDFFHVTLDDVSFLGSEIGKSYFLPAEIDRDSDDDVLLSIKGLEPQKLVGAINRSGGNTLIINIATRFGGGIATGKAVQSGGLNLNGQSDDFIEGLVAEIIPLLSDADDVEMLDVKSKIIGLVEKYSTKE